MKELIEEIKRLSNEIADEAITQMVEGAHEITCRAD